MKNGTAFLSCFFAAMAGLCLVGGCGYSGRMKLTKPYDRRRS